MLTVNIRRTVVRTRVIYSSIISLHNTRYYIMLDLLRITLTVHYRGSGKKIVNEVLMAATNFRLFV